MTSFELPSTMTFYGAAFISCLCIYAIIINILAFVTYFLTPSLREAHQNLTFFVILCCSLISSVQCIAMHSQLLINNSWRHLNDFCSLEGFLLQTIPTIQIFTLFVMALDRYFAITKASPFSKKLIISLIAFGAIGCSLTNTVPFLNPEWNYVPAPSKMYCIGNFTSPAIIALNLFNLILGLFIIAFILAIYVRIYLIFKRVSRNRKVSLVITNVHVSTMDQQTNEKEYKILVTTVALSIWTVAGD
jgi:hypothetical protein